MFPFCPFFIEIINLAVDRRILGNIDSSFDRGNISPGNGIGCHIDIPEQGNNILVDFAVYFNVSGYRYDNAPDKFIMLYFESFIFIDDITLLYFLNSGRIFFTG